MVGDSGLIALGKLLSSSKKLERLSINVHGIPTKQVVSWAPIFEGLKKNRGLQELALESHVMSTSYEALISILGKSESMISHLSLNTPLSLQDAVDIFLSLTLNTKLRHFKIAHIRPLENSQNEIAPYLFLLLAHNTVLQSLAIQSSQLSSAVFRSMICGLSKNKRSKLYELSLSGNLIGLDYGYDLATNSVWSHWPELSSLKTLRILDLSFNKFHEISIALMVIALHSSRLWKVILDYHEELISYEDRLLVEQVLTPTDVLWTYSQHHPFLNTK